MKSSQLNFYIHPDDLIEIEKFFKNRNTLFVEQPIESINNPFITSITYPKPKNQFDKTYLTDNTLLENLFFDRVDKQGYFLVKDISSYVIEFSRGGFLFEENKLERARLYFVKSYFDGGEEITKSEKFISWASGIIKDFKKNFLIKPTDNKGYYFSKRVLDWKKKCKAELDTAGLKLIAPP